MKGNQRILLIVAAIAVAIVAFIVISPGGDDDNSATPTTATPAPEPAPEDNVTTATVRVVDAKPQGGIKTIKANKGDKLRLTVVSDTADEVHVHGYDLSKDVTAGGTVRFSFTTDIEGIFEIELEHLKEQIAKLVVEP